MGAVFTIFLLLPLIILIYPFEILGIDLLGIFQQITESITVWLQANPETAAIIGDFLKNSFDVVMKAAEIANSIFIS